MNKRSIKRLIKPMLNTMYESYYLNLFIFYKFYIKSSINYKGVTLKTFINSSNSLKIWKITLMNTM